VVVSASLKSFWNLFNVCQVLVYIKIFLNWPVVVKAVLDNLDDAITMKKVKETVMNYGMSEFAKTKEMFTDEGLKELGIENVNVFK